MALGILAGIAAGAGALSSLFGAISNQRSAAKYSSMRQQALDKANAISQEQMDLYKQQLSEWESVFGNVQQTVSDYYNSLTPEKRIQQGFQNLESQYNQASTRVNQQLAQRGLATSGASAQANTALLQSLASQKAEVATNAESQVAQEQASYLQLGLNQKSNLLSGLTNAQNTAIQLNANAANTYGALADQSSQATYQSLAGIGSALGSAYNTYAVASALGQKGTDNLNNSNEQQTLAYAPIYRTDTTQGYNNIG